MSGIINSYFIEPALRQARRFSTTPDPVEVHASAPQSASRRSSSLSQLQAVEDSAVARHISSIEHVSSPDSAVAIFEDEPTEEILPSANSNPTTVAGRDPSITAVAMRSTAESDAFDAAQAPNVTSETESTLSQVRPASTFDHDLPLQTTNLTANTNANSVGEEPPVDRRDVEEYRGFVQESLAQSHGRQDSSSSTVFPGTLPANDGMSALRAKLHQIREMALSSEEKARRIHTIMTADYNALRSRQKESGTTASSRRSSRGSTLKNSSRSALQLTSMDIPSAKSLELRRQYNVKAADLRPTFQSQSPVLEDAEAFNGLADEEKDLDEELEFGCKHYMRNVKIQCSDCQKWYTCRHCHDEAQDHALARKRIENMLCMFCGLPQPAGEFCKGCDETAALYYCDKCKLWDNDPQSRIYHCDDCGICRRGEGLGKDFVHCKKCSVCISIRWAETHRCVERATDCDCPICGEYMFTSSSSVVAMRCGHYIHRNCYDAYMQRSYKCPICNRSAVNMELQWRKLDQAIETQPMPEQYRDSMALIVCNDCNGRSETKYHWLGLKCHNCDSYNTQELHVSSLPDVNRATGREDPIREESVQTGREASAAPRRDDSPTPVNHEHAIQPILDFRAHSPLPDAFAASALDDPSHLVSNDLAVQSHTRTPEHASVDSPPIAGTTVHGSPSSAEALLPTLSAHARSVSGNSQPPPEPYFHGDNSPFWGDSISPSAILNRIGSPVLSRIGSPVWSSPRLFGSSPPAQSEIATARRRSESDDEEDYFIDEDDGGGFGWGISPSGWGISPPAFFAERFLRRGKTSRAEEDDDEEEEDGDEDDQAASQEQSESESGSEAEKEHEEGDVEDESEFFQLPGHR